MNANDLKSALKYLGWSGADLARRVKVDKNTVSRWVTGATAVPGPIEVYLGVMVELKRLME